MSGALSATTIAAVAAGATAVSAAASVAGALGVFGGKSSAPSLPTPVVPAQAASVTQGDTGSTVHLGAADVKNQRISGSTNGGVTAQSTNTVDILGGLGAGGINV